MANGVSEREGVKLGWFVGGAVAVAAAIGLLLYADGYFDRSNQIELKIELPRVDVQ